MFPTTINFFRIRTHICYLLDDKNLEKLQTLWAPTDSSAKMEVTAKIMVGLIIPWKKHGDFRNRITVPLHCMHAKLLQLCPTLCNPMDCSLPGSSVRGDSPGKNTGVGRHAILQRIFQIQRTNLHLLRVLYWQAGSFPLVPPGKTLLFISKPLFTSRFANCLYIIAPKVT